MKANIRVGACLASLLCATSLVAAQPSNAPQRTAQQYLALRQTLKATTLTPAQAVGPCLQWRGQCVELYGRIVGRTNSCNPKVANPFSFMLLAPGQKNAVVVDSPQDNPLISMDKIVHVLAEMPANAQPTDHFVMKAIVAEKDLPAAEHQYATAMAALQQAAKAAAKPPPPAAVAESAIQADKNAEKATQVDVTAAAGANNPAQAPPRPGTNPPPRLASNVPQKTIEVWKKWVRGINSHLTDDQAELIVRSVLYYSALYGVDHRLSFAMIKCESDFDPKCSSCAGACGLTQLMPGTAQSLGVNPWDIEQNICGGIQYMSEQLHAYSGCGNYQQFALGLASYNAGPNAVKRAGGVPNIPETVHYVQKVGELFCKLYKDGMP